MIVVGHDAHPDPDHLLRVGVHLDLVVVEPGLTSARGNVPPTAEVAWSNIQTGKSYDFF